jgi:REP element-mobilizing transposase RayT
MTLHRSSLMARRTMFTCYSRLAEQSRSLTSSRKWRPAHRSGSRTKGREFRNFHWQRGYGAFSIGQSNVVELKRYIRNQKEHQCRITFEDEYRVFLKRYEIGFDERYVWD